MIRARVLSAAFRVKLAKKILALVNVGPLKHVTENQLNQRASFVMLRKACVSMITENA